MLQECVASKQPVQLGYILCGTHVKIIYNLEYLGIAILIGFTPPTVSESLNLSINIFNIKFSPSSFLFYSVNDSNYSDFVI